MKNTKPEERTSLMNPRRYHPCGPRAGTERATLPEPEHHECKECHKRIAAILDLRKPPPAPSPKPEQPALFELTPIGRGRGAR